MSWNLNDEVMWDEIESARYASDRRLLAVGYKGQRVAHWLVFPDEIGLTEFLNDNRAAIPLVVVHPLDTNEQIVSVLGSKKERVGTAPGYYPEMLEAQAA